MVIPFKQISYANQLSSHSVSYTHCACSSRCSIVPAKAIALAGSNHSHKAAPPASRSGSGSAFVWFPHSLAFVYRSRSNSQLTTFTRVAVGFAFKAPRKRKVRASGGMKHLTFNGPSACHCSIR